MQHAEPNPFIQQVHAGYILLARPCSRHSVWGTKGKGARKGWQKLIAFWPPNCTCTYLPSALAIQLLEISSIIRQKQRWSLTRRLPATKRWQNVAMEWEKQARAECGWVQTIDEEWRACLLWKSGKYVENCLFVWIKIREGRKAQNGRATAEHKLRWWCLSA